MVKEEEFDSELLPYQNSEGICNKSESLIWECIKVIGPVTLDWRKEVFFGSRFAYFPRVPREDSRVDFLLLLLLVGSLGSVGSLCLRGAGKTLIPVPFFDVFVVVGEVLIPEPLIMGDDDVPESAAAWEEENCCTAAEGGGVCGGTLICAMPSFFFRDSFTL